MSKWIALLAGCLAAGCATMQDDAAKLVGSWRLVSFHSEIQDSGERAPLYGDAPRGYIVFTPEGRTMSYIEAAGRKQPQTEDERAAAFRTLLAYTGKYRVEGDKFITSVDGAWNAVWVGTDQVRNFKLDGNRLQIVTNWAKAPIYKNRVGRAVLVWERER
jgi:hypothetical protein